MKRKGVVIFAIICVLFGGYTAGIYAQPADTLTRRQLEQVEENSIAIAETVLEDTGREGQYFIQDMDQVSVYYGNVTEGQEKDAVVAVGFGPQNTVVTVYAADGNGYTYVGDMGDFYDVRNIQFIPVSSEGRDVIIIKETAEQAIGGFEVTDLIRGFFYNDEKEFQNVLQTPERIETMWNNEWCDNDLQKDDNTMCRITEETEIAWDLDGDPELNISRYQQYLTLYPEEGQTLIPPGEEEFTSRGRRVVTERFYWSDEWRRFILGEAVDTDTGETVAIIENRDASPYFLAGFQDDAFRIYRRDGSTDIVEGNTLEWVTPEL